MGVAVPPAAVPPAPVPVQPQGQRINPLACSCIEKVPHAVVSGSSLLTASSRFDFDAYVSCSVVAAVRHSVSPVCTWRASDISDVCVEGWKLAARVGKRKDGFGQQQFGLFGRKWRVDVGHAVYKNFVAFEDGAELGEELQQHLLRDGMCVLDLHRAVNLIIQHGDYFVVVDCGVRNASGLASDIGRSAVVFNTCWNDLMIHILNLKESLAAGWFGVSSISVEECVAEGESCSAPVLVDPQALNQSQSCTSIKGSFHQGDQRFKYGGVQCMAISLVALVKHTTESVFSWQPDTLDKVVVSGDELYTSLREGNLITAGAEYLCVPDLPQQCVLDGQTFDVEFGDFFAGDVDVVTGQFIDAGVHTTLSDGLSKVCTKYDTCLFTLIDSTCAIISKDGQYAVVDSHARSGDGMVDVAGQSVVLYFSSLQHLFEHFCKFAGVLQTTPKLFEISGVHVRGPNESHTLSLGASAAVDCGEEQVTAPTDKSPVEPVVCAATVRGEKRKLTLRNSTLKKVKSTDYVVLNSDVVFIADVGSKNLQFHPLSQNVALALCRQINIESERVDATSSAVGPLGTPCRTQKIVGDGNCFFRAVSQAISGTQRYHVKFRRAVVRHLERNPVAYEGILRSEYSSMSEYLNVSRMGYVGSWATELEIQAAADCLGVSVFTFFNDRWLEYSCKTRHLSNEAVYLENCNSNHYETVVCVHQPQTQSCYSYCKVNTPGSGGYHFRCCSKDDSSVSGVDSLNPVRCSVSDHFKKKHNLHCKTKLNKIFCIGNRKGI